MSLHNLNIKFIFYGGGLGGNAIARAIACRLPFSNNYNISYVETSINEHSCNDIFCGLFHNPSIGKSITSKLKLSSNYINNLTLSEKKILLEFCFKLWLTSSYEYYPENLILKKNISQDQQLELDKLRLYVNIETLTPFMEEVVDFVIASNLPKNLPPGPYLSKGHFILWEHDLKNLFPNCETIYLKIKPKTDQIYMATVLFFVKMKRNLMIEMVKKNIEEAKKEFLSFSEDELKKVLKERSTLAEEEIAEVVKEISKLLKETTELAKSLITATSNQKIKDVIFDYEKKYKEKVFTEKLFFNWIRKDNSYLQYNLGDENKNQSKMATYVFNAINLIVYFEEEQMKKLLKIFDLNLNGIMRDFLQDNAQKNQKMIKNFNVDSLDNTVVTL